MTKTKITALAIEDYAQSDVERVVKQALKAYGFGEVEVTVEYIHVEDDDCQRESYVPLVEEGE